MNIDSKNNNNDRFMNNDNSSEKEEIIKRLIKYWNKRMENDFLSPKFLYAYTLDELKNIERKYLTDEINNDSMINNIEDAYIYTFVDKYPEYNNEDFFEYVATYNNFDIEISDLHKLSKEEVERLANEWLLIKNSIEKIPVVKDTGIINVFKKLRSAIYDEQAEIKNTNIYLTTLNNLFNSYKKWVKSYFEGDESFDGLVHVMNELNRFMDKYKLPANKYNRFDENINDIMQSLITKKNKPSIFKSTIYRMPTEEEIDEFENFQDLNALDIVDGFTYTIVGKSIKTPQKLKMIIDSIQMLCDRYPGNIEYKKALEIVKLEYNNELLRILDELRSKYLSNEAVENIRIENDEIVFDVKCETEVHSNSEYNGFKLRFNYLCDIDNNRNINNNDENIINENVVNDYSNNKMLLESPDNITIFDFDNKTTSTIFYEEEGSKPFAFVLKKMRSVKPEDLGYLWIGDWSEGHMEDCPLLVNNGGSHSYFELLCGRLWFKDSKGNDLKIISLWEKVPKETLQHIVTEIEKQGYDLSDWSYDTGEYTVMTVNNKKFKVSETIPLKEMGIKFLPQIEIERYRMKREKEKEKEYRRLKKYDAGTPQGYYRFLIRGESKTYNFDEYFKNRKINLK